MMCRETLATMGVQASLVDRHFDMARVNPRPDVAKIRDEILSLADELRLLGLDTLDGCREAKTDKLSGALR